MRPLSRKPTNKARGARAFRNDTKRTKSLNFKVVPRGGIRL